MKSTLVTKWLYGESEYSTKEERVMAEYLDLSSRRDCSFALRPDEAKVKKNKKRLMELLDEMD